MTITLALIILATIASWLITIGTYVKVRDCGFFYLNVFVIIFEILKHCKIHSECLFLMFNRRSLLEFSFNCAYMYLLEVADNKSRVCK